jgi:aryl-alcohol dehydrogenase-like predicted oxidoreductase
MKKRNKSISRKEFIKRSSLGILGAGILYDKLNAGCNFQNIPRKRILGKTGMEVTILCYGASRTNEPSLVRRALSSGINFIDTGRSYFNGQNEVMVGNVLRDIRKDIIIQTKARIRLRETGEELKTNNAFKKISSMLDSSLEASMKALQTDYIDILLVHGASSEEIIHHEAVLEFFQKAKRKGVIRACGFSSHGNQIQLLKSTNEKKFYDVVMIPYTHKGSFIHSNTGHEYNYDQKALETELKKAEKNNIGIVAMKTCSGGPYTYEKEKETTFNDAINWVLNHSYIHSAVVAMANNKEIDEDIQVMY